MEKILVLGNNGMLGHIVHEKLSEKGFLVFGTHHRDESNNLTRRINLYNFFDLRKLIEKTSPDVVINCAGILHESEIKIHEAIRINGELPHFLDILSDELDFKLIHISTDCVFDGKKGNYLENDKKTAQNYYGLSKSIGELINTKNLTIRTSIIGPELKNGTGLLNWVLTQKKKEITGYTRVIWTGLTTIELTNFIIHIIQKKINISGIVHATNGKKISKYEIIKLINKIFNLKLNIIKDKTITSDKSLINTKNDLYEFQDYEKQLEELKIFMESKNLNYIHYQCLR